ncbi:hypothetical protein OOZ54_13165 [Rhodopseudomonas palustris]|uniref:hypothetical protein n=1 Tax=Rhodopseudomonas palustris TaxID=1076 RepID=UPI0022F0F8A2|nr:hypothetical protein [Rhodopseudomonas palustris]WBU27618.1 hypothetical protein OOZ54_13165 [Rhodopseudomonas palustris]
MTHSIPQSWIWEARLGVFRPSTKAFLCDEPHTLVPMECIVPPKRNEGVELDEDGFGKARAMWILARIYNAEPIPPIRLAPNVPHDVRDGFHRFYISLALGYSHIPADVETWT